MVEQKNSYRIIFESDDVRTLPLFNTKSGNGGGGKVPPTSNKNNNGFADHRDLDLLETKLTSRIESSEERLYGEIKVINSKLDFLKDKVETTNSKLSWITTLIVGSMLVPIFIKLFIK